MTKTPFPDDMDPACVPVCEALRALPGVETTSSCEGHGRQPPMIDFRVRSIAALHPIVRAIDRRYYAYSADRLHCVVHDCYDDWWLLRVVETDLVDDRIRFCLTTRDVPEDAARMLALLAENVADAARQLADWEVAEGRASRLQISEISEGAPRTHLVVALPGVVARVAAAAPGRARLDVANLGTVPIYLGDVAQTSSCKLRLGPGEKIWFDHPSATGGEFYAIAEDPPPRAVRPIDDAGDQRAAEEHDE